MPFLQRKKKICHEGKPVAVREKLFKILTRAHKQCQHGGRDKTSAQVRKIYSWVPKELISRFVKICPTCKARRGSNSQLSPPVSPKNRHSLYSPPQSPQFNSPLNSRRDSVLPRYSSMLPSSPVSTSMYGSQYQGNQWLSPAQNSFSPGTVHSSPPNGTIPSSPMVNTSQNGMPLSYTSPGFHNPGLGSHRSYANDYDTPTSYSQHHHY